MSINVLWVEDEPASMRWEHLTAQNEGWIITFADTVSKALELMKDRFFDLIVVDLIIPDDEFQKRRGFAGPQSGIRLVRSIRDTGRVGLTKNDVPLLAITAMGQETAKEVIKELSSTRYYINKPITDTEAYTRLIHEISQRLKKSMEHNN
jgi:CheY-like chemotaxis protein